MSGSGLDAGRQFVFIVGCPRSGTTWLQRLLASHPDVRTGQETHLFNNYVGPPLRSFRRHLELADQHGPSSRYVGLPGYLTNEEFQAVVQEFLYGLLGPILRQLGDGGLYVEKSPSHALWLREIHGLLPEARFVEIVRDPREVVASLLHAHRTWGRWWAPGTVRRAAVMWAQHVRAVDEASAELGEEQIHRLRYEDLRRDGVAELSRIARFLSLPWSAPAIAEAVASNSRDAVASESGSLFSVGGEFAKQSVTRNREPDGFFRSGSGSARGRRSELTLAQRLWLWRCLRKPMREHGYR